MRKKLLGVAAMAVLCACAWIVNRYSIRELPKTQRQTQPFNASGKFMVGINYPWVTYGNDFGSSFWGHEGVSTAKTNATVESDFAQLEAQHLTVVRWFLWADGHAGIHFAPDGTVVGLDSEFFADVDAALAIAQRHHIRIVFVLVDFKFFEGPPFGKEGRNWGGHDTVVTDAAARGSFLDKAVRPLLERYGKNPAIAAWEVVNEPEWEIGHSVRWGRKSFRLSQMQTFVSNVVAYIHHYAQQPATVGSIAQSFLPLWMTCNLDFYEVHSYPYSEVLNPLDQTHTPLHLDKPVLLGEFPTAHSSRPVTEYLDLAFNNGYTGAMPWSFRAQDKYSNYAKARQQLARWMQTH